MCEHFVALFVRNVTRYIKLTVMRLLCTISFLFKLCNRLLKWVLLYMCTFAILCLAVLTMKHLAVKNV
jgi:hypothetical protein